MNFKITFILCSCILLFSCKSDDWTKNYKIKKALITKVDKRHWGKGYFIETMTFQYKINGQVFINQYESNKKEQSYTSSYSVNDTLIFKYRPKNPNEFKALKLKKMRSKK